MIQRNNVFFIGTQTIGDTKDPGSIFSENGKILIRGKVVQAQDNTNDRRVSGELAVEINGYLDEATSWGPLWGTFMLDNPGGKWLAAWIGKKTAGGATIFAMGYGAGAYEGLMANWTYSQPAQYQQTHFNIQGFIVRTS